MSTEQVKRYSRRERKREQGSAPLLPEADMQHTSKSPGITQKWGALRIAGIYLVIGGLWILFSDRFAAFLTQDPVILTKISLYKGWGFIFITALLLYFMIRGYSMELRAGEKDLRASETLFSTIFYNSPVSICISKIKEGTIIEANEAFLQLFGYTREEIINHSSGELGMWAIPDDRKQVVEKLQKGQNITDVETSIKRKSAEILNVLISSEIVFINNDELMLTMVTDITLRKHAEEELAAQRDFAMQVMNTMGQGLTVSNKIRTFDYVNPAFANMVGYAPEEIIGKGPLDFVDSEDLKIQNEAHQARKRGETTQYEVQLYQKNGDTRPVLITGVPRMQKGEYIGSISVITDLTERKHTEETLAQQSNNLATLHELEQEITACLELSHIYEATHHAATRLIPGEVFIISLLHEIEDEIEDVYLWDRDRLWPNERYPAGQDLTGYIISQGAPLCVNEWDASYDLLTQANTFGYDEQDIYSLLAIPLFRTGGTCFGMMSIQSYSPQRYTPEHEKLLTTIANQVAKAIENAQLYIQVQQELSERKRAELELRNSRARLNTIIESAMDAIITIDGDQKIILFNAAAEQMFMVTAAEALGKPLSTFIPLRFHHDHEHYIEVYNLIYETQSLASHPIEGIIGLRSNGEEFPCEVSISRVETDDNILFTAILRDITKRRQAEEEIRYQARLLDNVSDVIVSTDVAFHIKYWNKAAETKYGWSVEEVREKVSWDVVPTSFVDSSFDEAKKALLKKGFWQGSLQQQSRDGLERIFLCSTTLLNDLQGKPSNLVFVLRDITESVKHQQEVEAIGQVSAALRTASTRIEMIPVILDQIEALFNAEATAFTAVDHRSNETVVEAVRGALAQALRPRLPIHEGISGQVLTTQKPYLNNHTVSTPLLPGANELFESQAVVCVPLIAHQQSIGTLWLARKPTLTEHDLHILVAVADIAANALYRAGLFEQTQQQLERLAILHAIDEAIASSFDVRPTLFILLDQIHTRLKLSAADVYLYNPQSYMLEFAAGNGFQGQTIKYTRLRLGETCTGQTALERQIIAIPAFQDYLAENPHPVHQLLQAEEFTTYFGIPLISKGQIRGVLELFHREPISPDEDWLDFLNTLSRQVAIAIDNVEMLEGVQRSKLELELAYDATIEGWSRVLDLRDKETEGHSQRVTELTLRLARELRIPEAEIVHIRRGALLHDIGKMGVPDAILLKPDKLTPEEWDVMRQHPSLAYEMLSSIAYLKPALDIPLNHHEKWDGTGYPHGLKGEQIPLAARIFAVADVWDALTSNRPYRRSAWSNDEALTYIKEQSGIFFDPQIVEVFMHSQAVALSQKPDGTPS